MNLNSLFDFTVLPSYKTELRILTSQAELLTQFFKKFLKVVIRREKITNIILELVARDF